MIKDSKVEFNIKQNIVMAVMLLIGLGTSYLGTYANITIGIPLSETVMLTGLSLAAIVGVLLNILLTIVFKTKTVEISKAA